MKAIILLAVVGFVLAVGFAVPFNDDDLEAQDNKLKDIGDELVDDYEPENLKSDYGIDTEDEDDDAEDDFEDEGDRDEEEEEDEDEDEVNDEDGGAAMERSSDPQVRGRRVRLRRVGRRIRRIGRRIGRRVGRTVRRIRRGVRRIGRRIGRFFRG